MKGSRHEEQINCLRCGKIVVESQINNHQRLSLSCNLIKQIDLAAEEINYDILGRHSTL